MDFGTLTEKESEFVTYSTISGAYYYVWNIVLGQIAYDSIGIGNGEMDWMLNILMVFSEFFMLILMLNMLIAIMGNTFANRQSITNQILMQRHLQYVIEHWHFQYFIQDQIRDIKYVIMAFVNDQDSGSQFLTHLQE